MKSAMSEGREQAEEVLERAMREAGEKKKISLIVEFVIGGIEETFHRMIEIYKPFVLPSSPSCTRFTH